MKLYRVRMSRNGKTESISTLYGWAGSMEQAVKLGWASFVAVCHDHGIDPNDFDVTLVEKLGNISFTASTEVPTSTGGFSPDAMAGF